jgi:hypothetical protein
MVRDTGCNRSSQRKLFGYCCDSSADKKEGHFRFGSIASVEPSWHVGFTPDFGRMVATR